MSTCSRPEYECAHMRALADQWQFVQTQLAPLCPCGVDGPNPERQQECPLHGDGETFVRYVQALEAAARVAYGNNALRIVWETVST